MNLTPTPKLKPQSTGTMGQSMLCYAKSLSCVLLFETPWTVAHQAPLSMNILQARILEWVAMPSSWKGKSCYWIGRIKAVKMTTLAKAVKGLTAIFIKSPRLFFFFCRSRTKNFKICMDTKKNLNS